MKKLTFLILLLPLLPPALFAGWSEPIRLTYRGYEMRPQIIAVGETLHVAWTQIADSQNVSYMQSIDGGQTWGQLVNLNSQPYGGRHVSLTENRGRIFAGWLGSVIYGQLDIVYTISQDGLAWTLPSYAVRGNTRIDEMVSATLSGDSIYAVYYAYGPDSTGNVPFRFLYSSDLGQTWSNEQSVAYARPGYCNGLIISKCMGVLYIVWNADPIPESTTIETQAVVSYNGGLTWSLKTFLSQNGGRPAQTACASCNPVDGSFAVGWMDYGYPGYFYMRITDDFGVSWSPEIHIADGHYIADPNLEFVGDTLWAAWTDRGFSSYPEIGFTKSMDRGNTWQDIQCLTQTTYQAVTPWLAYANGKVYVVWEEDTHFPDNMDLYLKYYTPGDDIDETPNLKLDYGMKGYPNPFNSTTMITYKNIEGGEIQVYDISGRMVRQLSVLSNKEGMVSWNATDNTGNAVSSGIYLAKAKIQHGQIVSKLIYLK